MVRSALLMPNELLMIFAFKFGMLQVRENEISLRKWPGGIAHLRTLEEMLPKMH